jgi:hypothetical protein
MKRQLRRIDPISAAKISAVLYALMGLCFVPFVMAMNALMPVGEKISPFGTGFALAMPVVYGIFGAIFSFLGAALYNLIARFVGGLEIEVRDVAAPL